MTIGTVKPIPDAGFFTSFVHEHGIDCLIRSADWYKLPPIQRYLYNMAAAEIRMEDAKTETRSYTFERFDHLRQLIERCGTQEWETAWEAWMLWGSADLRFGVVHLEQVDGRRGNLILGDGPDDVGEFAPDDDHDIRTWNQVQPSIGPEGGVL